ncbi:hypothetical protein [Parasitella parasitica]|uniref:Uncharacterized protein n=1 Tax=Parasitella parasitica TaxID=35722 RepID=A0A0B7NPT1_9FUNG|nr:hypothetical protein [Parasitella parasitica]
MSAAGIFNIGCTKPIHQDLDAMQGLKPNLKNHLQFGYIYNVDSPQVDLDTDIPIKHLEQYTWLPSKVVAILSGVSYSEIDSKLVLTSRISKLNANRIKLASLDSANIKFGTFAYDGTKKKWYTSLKNGNLGGISGKVAKSNIIHQQNGKDSHYELVLELTPLKKITEKKVQFFKYATTTSDSQILWDGLASGCHSYKKKGISNKRDHFNEIIESAVLL